MRKLSHNCEKTVSVIRKASHDNYEKTLIIMRSGSRKDIMINRNVSQDLITARSGSKWLNYDPDHNLEKMQRSYCLNTLGFTRFQRCLTCERVLGWCLTWWSWNWSPPKAATQGLMPPVPRAIRIKPTMDRALRAEHSRGSVSAHICVRVSAVWSECVLLTCGRSCCWGCHPCLYLWCHG